MEIHTVSTIVSPVFDWHRCVRERVRQGDMPNIVSDDDILGGEPRIEGTRIGVRHVAARVIDAGQSPAHAADQLDCSLAAIYEALSYYCEHIDEMRDLERANDDAFERVRESSLQPKETRRQTRRRQCRCREPARPPRRLDRKRPGAPFPVLAAMTPISRERTAATVSHNQSRTRRLD